MHKPKRFIIASTLINWLLATLLAATFPIPIKTYPAFFLIFLLIVTLGNIIFLKKAKAENIASEKAGRLYFLILIEGYIFAWVVSIVLTPNLTIESGAPSHIGLAVLGPFLWPMIIHGLKLAGWLAVSAGLFLIGTFLGTRAYKIWLGITIAVIALLLGPLIVPIWWSRIVPLLVSISIGLLAFAAASFYLKLGMSGIYARANLGMWIVATTVAALMLSFHFGSMPSDRIVSQKGVRSIERFDEGGPLAKLMYLAKTYMSWYSCDGDFVFASKRIKLFQSFTDIGKARNLFFRNAAERRWHPLPSIYRDARPPVNCSQGITFVGKGSLLIFNPPSNLRGYRLPVDIQYAHAYKTLLPRGTPFPLLLEVHAYLDETTGKHLLRTIWVVNENDWSWVADPESVSVACPIENGRGLLVLNGKDLIAVHLKLSDDNRYAFVEHTSLEDEITKFDRTRRHRKRITGERDSCWCLKDLGCYYYSRLRESLYHWSLNPIRVERAVTLPTGRCWVFVNEGYNMVFVACETQGALYAFRGEDLKYLGAIYTGDLTRAVHFNPQDPNRAIVLSKAGLFEIDLTEAFNLPNGIAKPNERPDYLRAFDKIFWGGWF